MPPTAKISHSTAERLRVRLPAHKRDVAFFARLEVELRECPEIEAVRANPTTASVLIFHHSTTEQIVRWAEERGLFQIFPQSPEAQVREEERLRGFMEYMGTQHSKFVRAITRRTMRLDERIEEATDDRLNLTGMAAFSLFGLSIYQAIKKGDFLPDGATLFWYAVRLILEEEHTTVHHLRRA